MEMTIWLLMFACLLIALTLCVDGIIRDVRAARSVSAFDDDAR